MIVKNKFIFILGIFNLSYIKGASKGLCLSFALSDSSILDSMI